MKVNRILLVVAIQLLSSAWAAEPAAPIALEGKSKKGQTPATYTGVVFTNEDSGGGGICMDLSTHTLMMPDVSYGIALKGKDHETANLLTSFADGKTTVTVQGISIEHTDPDTGECSHLLVFTITKESSN